LELAPLETARENRKLNFHVKGSVTNENGKRLGLQVVENIGSGGRDRTADLGVMNPPFKQCANHVLAAFTNIFRGSQPVGSAPV
jgi:hypothetical protein